MAERPTEARHPSSAGLHAVPGPEALRLLLDAQAEAVMAVAPAIVDIERAAQAAARALRTGHRMAYAGAGSSGVMALSDALELWGTFGLPPDRTPVLLAGGPDTLLHMTGTVEDDPSLAQADFDRLGFVNGDVLICVSASGGTPYTLALAEMAQAVGLCVVGLASVPGSRLLQRADIPILLDTGPEVVSGSTRLGAGTASKVALNLLSTRVGLLLGHVHDGYMVNVVADNAKLLDRAARIVSALSGRDMKAATEALSATRGAVKLAVLVARGLTPDEARATLAASGGTLPDAPVANDSETPPSGGRRTP
ncbi:N-acetylmuramic acid 6-phosphate etherase [Rubellimicrobium roseum]|uniref:N-acetylmuramic acid 6-phosphate etherase n=1 Tax=Rubellimicrobium roseum TaxID=687525 RepID=A0A5C4NH89_9RHOB|nr:N-acetylmuramic acid 6-phosphate etherase [Rubellimicrobium roseum]TNC73290.1 N-acetylmuramic acid 6-phosphate etherase [Rubellimicrobium roseum]